MIKKPAHKHEGCLWGLPGGHQEYRESSLAAAARELREEVGLCTREEIANTGRGDTGSRGAEPDVEAIGWLGWVEDVQPGVLKHYVTQCWLFQRLPETFARDAEGVGLKLCWFPVDALPANITMGFKAVIAMVNNTPYMQYNPFGMLVQGKDQC